MSDTEMTETRTTTHPPTLNSVFFKILSFPFFQPEEKNCSFFIPPSPLYRKSKPVRKTGTGREDFDGGGGGGGGGGGVQLTESLSPFTRR